MGVDYVQLMKKPSQSDVECKLFVWDTAGAERFRSLSLAFYKRAQGAVITFDLSRRESFDRVSQWVRQVNDNCPESVTMLLVGNKCDLEREIDEEECQQLATDHGMQYIETSAKENTNVDQLFQAIIDAVYNKSVSARISMSGLTVSNEAPRDDSSFKGTNVRLTR